MGMVFCRCRGVTLRGYTYRNAANWCHQLDSCIQVRMDHVTVLGGHDGVNLHHCTQVWIDSCDFRTGDDCIAGYDAENVVVRNCSLNTSCNSFRFGGRNLLVEHCRFWGPGNIPTAPPGGTTPSSPSPITPSTTTCAGGTVRIGWSGIAPSSIWTT